MFTAQYSAVSAVVETLEWVSSRGDLLTGAMYPHRETIKSN